MNDDYWNSVAVPNFRDCARAWAFFKKHKYRRLPAKTERVFLKDIKYIIEYSKRIRVRLPFEFEEVIRKNDPYQCLSYISVTCEGGKRYEEFEECISKNPEALVKYSINIVKGRLPSHLEERLIGNEFACYEYAYSVLDGHLPENLHNFMFAASMTNNKKRYFGNITSKINDDYMPNYISASEYFCFLRHRSECLYRQITNCIEVSNLSKDSKISDLLNNLQK